MSDDYTKLIEEAREWRGKPIQSVRPSFEILEEMADAVGALVGREAELERTNGALIAIAREADADHDYVVAERDALRAQLDSMRTEERTAWSGDYLSDDDFRQVTLQRLVGPWTPVEGEQA